MAFGLRGHNPGNDDLTGPGQDPNSDVARGYTGTYGGIGDSTTKKAGNGWEYTGEGYDMVNGWKQAGTSAYDKDVARQRAEGAAAQQRQAYQLDQRQADESRGLQMGGLQMMDQAAQGYAPSRAAVLGQAATDNTTRGALGNLAAGRGQGGAIMGANQAGTGAAGQYVKTNAAVTDLRAAEIGRAQKGLAEGAQQMRGQDDAAAIANAKFEAQQRALNEAKQQGKESLAFDTRKSQLQNAQDYEANVRKDQAAHQRQTDAYNSREEQNFDNTVSTWTGGVLGSMPSDERAKRNIHPVTMGSLSGLSRFMHGR